MTRCKRGKEGKIWSVMLPVYPFVFKEGSPSKSNGWLRKWEKRNEKKRNFGYYLFICLFSKERKEKENKKSQMVELCSVWLLRKWRSGKKRKRKKKAI